MVVQLGADTPRLHPVYRQMTGKIQIKICYKFVTFEKTIFKTSFDTSRTRVQEALRTLSTCTIQNAPGMKNDFRAAPSPHTKSENN